MPIPPDRVFAVPPAGAGASFYRRFSSPRLGLVGLNLPGREGRYCEQSLRTVDECAIDIASQVLGASRGDVGSVSLMGHSFGALVAWRAALLLLEQGLDVSQLIVSGAAAPTRTRAQLGHLEDQVFLEQLAELTGSPHEALALPALRPLVMPALRADLEASGAARYAASSSSELSIICAAGRDDPVVQFGGLEGWADCSSRQPSFHWFPGGHMYLRDDPEGFMSAIESEVLRERATQPRS